MMNEVGQGLETQLAAILSKALELYHAFRPIEADSTRVAALVIAPAPSQSFTIGRTRGTFAILKGDVPTLLKALEQGTPYEPFHVGLLLENGKIVWFKSDEFNS